MKRRKSLKGIQPEGELKSLQEVESIQESVRKLELSNHLIDREIRQKEDEIETDERIVRALIKVKAKHLKKVKNILSLKDVQDVDSIDKVKSIKPVKSVDNVKRIQDVKMIQKVKRMYALTPAQAAELKKLLTYEERKGEDMIMMTKNGWE